MNIKRGLFRFWLIITLLWIAASGSYTFYKLYPLHPRPVAAIDDAKMLESIKQARVFESGTMNDATCKAYSDAITADKLYSLIPVDCSMYKLLWGNPVVTTIKTHPLTFYIPNCAGGSAVAGSGDAQAVAYGCKVTIYSFTDAGSVASAVNQSYEDYRDGYWYRKVPLGIGIIIVPPVALFLFGLLGLWIAKGFK